MAVLRFENLGTDPSDDWMGRAFAEIIATELSGVPDLNLVPSARLHTIGAGLGVRPAAAPGISAERPLALAAGSTVIAYGDYWTQAGRVNARLTIEDPAARRTIRVLTASAPDIYTAATDLANQISSPVQPYTTRNTEAIRAYSTALESDGATAMAELERAVAADPNFGAPYELLSQFKMQRQDRAGAEALLESALARGSAIAPADRARLQVQLAGVRGDAPGRLKALTELTAAAPRDASAWRSLADNLMAVHEYSKSADAYRKAVAFEANDGTAWNQLGYAAAYAGDSTAAMNALRRYQEMFPSDPNPVDSMGDVSLISGRLREAEDFYLQASKLNPGFLNHGDLFKAAMARLMSGDLAGADALAQKYAEARAGAHDPRVPMLRAEWSWLSGRRREACRQIEEYARSAEPAQALRAYNQLAVWNLMLGDRAGAQTAASKVQPAAAAAIPLFFLQPPASAGEWSHRGLQLIPNPAASALRDSTVGAALLFAREFFSAAPILKNLYESPSGPSDPSLPVTLAWTLIETGHTGDAGPLLRWNPIPPPTGPSALVSLYFPRLYYLRAVLADKTGKRDEARENYSLFLKLSGPDPLQWGEERKAQAALQ